MKEVQCQCMKKYKIGDKEYISQCPYCDSIGSMVNPMITLLKFENLTDFEKQVVQAIWFGLYDRTTYDQVRTVAETNLNDLKNYLSNLYGEDETEEIYKDKESAIDILTECLIDDTEFFLPRPEVTEDTTKMTQFENFNTRLDGVLGALISDDTITESALGNLNVNKDALIKMLKLN